MQKYKYINFFNKKGEYCNFTYDEVNDKWTGRVDLNIVSEGLIEDYQIYILEEIYNYDQGQYEFTKPIIDSSYLPGGASALGTTAAAITINGSFQVTKPIPEIFLYTFDITESSDDLVKTYDMDFEFDTVPYTLGTTADSQYGIKKILSTNIDTSPLQINIGFAPESEDLFGNFLVLKDANGHIFAEIFVYGESEEEDERLANLLGALGYDLLPGDFVIFEDTDVNEIKPDWRLLNQKRKELLLEYDNIFPYLGSYKALINIIKFFGHQNLRMKEYWKNVDQTSANFGKYKQMNIEDIFSESANFNNTALIPSKIYRKTNKFGLFYDITRESEDFDEDGLPIIEEVYTYSPEEVLIKIFALKKKLQNYFLGTNAKIVDIIGESIFFAKYEINVWNDQHRIDSVELGLKPTFEVLPSRSGYIEDLRPLTYFGTPVGTDLTIGGYTYLNSWRIGIGNQIDTIGPLDTLQTYELTVQIPTGSTAYTVSTTLKRDLDTGQTIYKNYEIANKIITNLKAVNYINTNFNVYQEGGTSGVIRMVQKNPGGTGTVFSRWYSDTDLGPGTSKFSIPGTTGGTSTFINVSPGSSFGSTGSPISYYSDSFLGYFDRINLDVKKLNDDEDIPVGYAVVLNNTTFDITWDDANVSFNQIDQVGATSNAILYGNFTNSQTVAGWTSSPGSTSNPIFAPVSGFPSVFPSQNVFTWENLGYYGYHEMQWIVSKVEDETPAFYHDSGIGLIKDFDRYPVILPYVGKYKVELYLWDGYNTKSYIINEDWIEVGIYDVDFIGWYNKMEREYTLSTDRYRVQSDYTPRIGLSGLPLDKPKSSDLTWDEYASTWDLPFHPNEEIGMAEISYNSLDSIEFYQNIKNPISNPLVDRYPYTFKLIGDEAVMDDLYHLWWDGTGTKITQFEINSITGPTSHIAMTKGNSVLNINSVSLHVVDGPTGYTGGIGVTSLAGSTGDLIHSYSNQRTYRYSGTEWKYEREFLDVYRATGLVGTSKQKFVELTRQLNIVMPNDGLSHPYLKDFIYNFEEEYDYTYTLNPYIRAVSKNFEAPKRHKLKFLGATGDNAAYETVYFGYLGDIPTSFEIYDVNSVGPTGSILITGMTAAYNIGSTNLYDLSVELNGPTAQSTPIIGDFTYNIVIGYSGMTGPTVSGMTATYTKIIAAAKAFKSPEEIHIIYDKINGTTYGRSLIKNPSWDEIRILKYSEGLPLCTTVNFTYDPSKMKGKKNAIWRLSKEGDPEFDDIYYNNRYFSYMFTEKGSYTISLQLEDTNGNINNIIKKEIIKII